ncbi:MAG: PEP-CTERM sorting domain-containing protein [Rhodocyclaceae bacterium]|nr:PEP-CTERM sorting domain-containing protein [Rhodocyclaceae bacterium]
MANIKHHIALGALATVFAGSAGAGQTSSIQFDPDGNFSASNAVQSVASFDWLPNSALVTSTVAGQSVTNPTFGSVVQAYSHARLGSILDGDGNKTGSLNGFELTFETGFRETVSSFTGSIGFGSVGYQITAGGDNFFRIYYDPSPGSNALTGRGYGSDAVQDTAGAVLLLEGTVLPYDPTSGRGQSNFITTGQTSTRLDNFGTNNYGTISSVVGQGSSTLAVQITNIYRTDFFQNFRSGDLLLLDTQLNAPFTQVDPSSCFTTGSGTLISGPGSPTGAPSGKSGCAGNKLGSRNGTTGPWFELQADASSSFLVVPEPGGIALLGLGLGLLSLTRRKARH